MFYNAIDYKIKSIMYMQSRNTSGKQEEEFNKPVESIMRCEDFKSNFARRLSNRYISRSPVSSATQDTGLKLRPLDNGGGEDVADNVPERIELASQLSKNNNMEQNGDTVKPPDKLPYQDSGIRKTEVTVLNMEVETLRWQLAQIEANRQMHIALLKQIVAFLNRVKEHIEGQNNDSLKLKKGNLPTRLLPRSFNVADFPRSRSVVQVNKIAEYSLLTPKRISTRTISKSISNVNRLRDCDGVNWSQSKLSLTPEMEISQKISEEMSRLINLANTVLSTKLPDLACSCNDKNSELNTIKLTDAHSNTKTKDNKDLSLIMDQIEKNEESFITPNTIENNIYSYKSPSNHLAPPKEESLNALNESALSVVCGQKDGFSDIPMTEKHNILATTDQSIDILIGAAKAKSSMNARNEIVSSNFIEDESGFSSMSSFQEIGIPIISIIPPSPCKEIGLLEDIPDILDDAEKWKTDTMQLEKQSVKVFWV